jgi:hypothetical protein
MASVLVPHPEAKPISVALATTSITDLQSEMDAKGLGDASRVRRLVDLHSITDSQITDMNADDRDRSKILLKSNMIWKRRIRMISNSIPYPQLSMAPLKSPFLDGSILRGATILISKIQVVSAKHDIFRARLFTVEQCRQINRMAECHAYPHMNRAQFDHGWTNKLYTLTARHLFCKHIPGFLSITKLIVRQLLRAPYDMFPDRIKSGTICWENPGEPHLASTTGMVVIFRQKPSKGASCRLTPWP